MNLPTDPEIMEALEGLAVQFYPRKGSLAWTAPNSTLADLNEHKAEALLRLVIANMELREERLTHA